MLTSEGEIEFCGRYLDICFQQLGVSTHLKGRGKKVFVEQDGQQFASGIICHFWDRVFQKESIEFVVNF